MNSSRSRSVIQEVQAFQTQLNPILAKLAFYRNNNYNAVPPVFLYNIPISLQEIDRHFGYIIRCIEHRPAPLERAFNVEEATTVANLALRSKTALSQVEQVQTTIDNGVDPNQLWSLSTYGQEILGRLDSDGQAISQFYSNLQRTVDDAKSAAQRRPPSQPPPNANSTDNPVINALINALHHTQLNNGMPTQPDPHSLRAEYDRGYREGMTNGKQTGHEQGFEQGLKMGDEQGFSRGFNEGEKQGHRSGKDEGKAEGRAQACERVVAMGGLDEQKEPTHVLRAVQNGSLDDLKLLRKMNMDFDRLSLSTESGDGKSRISPLRAAVKRGDAEAVDLLLSFGVQIRTQEPDGSNVLLEAAKRGANGIIHLICNYGAAEMIKTLLKNRHQGGELASFTPLDVAVYYNHASTVQLLEEKCRISDLPRLLDDRPLHLAAARGNYSVVTYLLQHYDVNEKDLMGRSPLQHAVERCNLPIMELFLSSGADTESEDHFGLTALKLAINHATADQEAAYHNIITSMIDKDAQIERDDHRYSALIHAVQQGRESCVDILLTKGANPNFVPHRDTGLKPALHEAVDKGHDRIARSLLRARADISTRNELCGCPFEKSIENGDEVMLDLLLKQRGYGTFLAEWPRDRTGPIHTAITCGNSSMIPYLIEKGADIEFTSDETHVGNYTPLHHAANELDLEALDTLVRNGANAKARTRTGGCEKCLEVKGVSDSMLPSCYLENRRPNVTDISLRARLREMDETIKARLGPKFPLCHNPSKKAKRRSGLFG